MLCFVSLATSGKSQIVNNNDHVIDSLKGVIANSTVDSTIINTLSKWSHEVRISLPDSAKVIHERIVTLCEDIVSNKEVKSIDLDFYNKSKAASFNELGSIESEHGNYEIAKDYYEDALKIFLKLEDQNGIAESKYNISKYFINTHNYKEASSQLNEAIILYNSTENDLGKAYCLSGLGHIHDNQGNYSEAIKNYLNSLEITEALNEKALTAQNLNNIGALYLNQNDLDKSLEYYEKALEKRKELESSSGIGQSLNNIGLIYEFQKNYDKAFEYYTEAYQINKQANIKSGMSYSLTNLGILHYWKKDLLKAIEYHKQSLKVRKEIGDLSGVASSYHDMAITHKDIGSCNQSIIFCNEALSIAEQIGYLEIQGGVLKTLYECHKLLRNNDVALSMFEKYITVKDSLENKANQREVLKQELTYTYEKQALADSLQFVQEQQLIESELKTKKQQSYFLLGGLALALLLGGFIFKQKKMVERERDKSDKLLLNILPEETARELKEKGVVSAKHYQETSILFTDFVGFSSLAESLGPEELLNELNFCFSEFDKIAREHGVEKIKTIGDSYMAVCGVPVTNENHAERTVDTALAINAFMTSYMKQRNKERKPFFTCRIGVNSGPLIAGVVGTQKFQYDVWGDAVNIASRMESKGASGKINISDSTYQLVKNNSKYTFDSRGEIRVKGDRDLTMYFISEGV